MTSDQPDEGAGENQDIGASPAVAVRLLRELNHRIKNNFQIIVSLMNLKKRALPANQREEMRFMEENVQSMAVAYRLVYASASMTHVSLRDLVAEVIAGLREIAGDGDERLTHDISGLGGLIHLDHAVALSLYLAVLLPPCLDDATATMGMVHVNGCTTKGLVNLSVTRGLSRNVLADPLRNRLVAAFAKQLDGEIDMNEGVLSLRFRLSPSAPPSLPAH